MLVSNSTLAKSEHDINITWRRRSWSCFENRQFRDVIGKREANFVLKNFVFDLLLIAGPGKVAINKDHAFSQNPNRIRFSLTRWTSL